MTLYFSSFSLSTRTLNFLTLDLYSSSVSFLQLESPFWLTSGPSISLRLITFPYFYEIELKKLATNFVDREGTAGSSQLLLRPYLLPLQDCYPVTIELTRYPKSSTYSKECAYHESSILVTEKKHYRIYAFYST